MPHLETLLATDVPTTGRGSGVAPTERSSQAVEYAGSAETTQNCSCREVLDFAGHQLRGRDNQHSQVGSRGSIVHRQRTTAAFCALRNVARLPEPIADVVREAYEWFKLRPDEPFAIGR